MLRSILILLFLPLYTLVGSAFGYVLARLMGSPRVLYRLGRLGARIALALAGTKVVLEGLGPLLHDHVNVVVMPNHTSNLDALVLFGLVPVDFKAVYKRELNRFPFFRHALHFAGFIDVDRSEKADARKAVARAALSLKSGNCFVIFPEGTRTRTGALGDFKKGGFVVAIEAGSRIVPVAIKGARALMPRGRFAVRPGEITLRVLDPVDAAAYSYEDRERLIALVRGRIQEALA